MAACLLLAFVGWFFLVSPQRAQATADWAELTAAQTQTAALRSRVNVMKTRFEGIEAARAGLELKRQSLPAGNALDTLVLALNWAGAQTGVTIDGVSAAEPIDITPIAPEPVPDPDAEADDQADEPEGTAAAPAPAAWPLFVLPVTIRATGSMSAMQNFMRIVQSEQPRAILFTSFTLSPSTDSQSFGEQVSLNAETRVFVSPIAAPPPGAAVAE